MIQWALTITIVCIIISLFVMLVGKIEDQVDRRIERGDYDRDNDPFGLL